MKKMNQLLLLGGFLFAGMSQVASANPLLDELNISQINPALSQALATPNTIVSFYGESYVVTQPASCAGPDFNSTCRVQVEHLTASTGTTVQINQKITGNSLVTTVTTKPDGKSYEITYRQTGAANSALNVINIQRIF